MVRFLFFHHSTTQETRAEHYMARMATPPGGLFLFLFLFRHAWFFMDRRRWQTGCVYCTSTVRAEHHPDISGLGNLIFLCRELVLYDPQPCTYCSPAALSLSCIVNQLDGTQSQKRSSLPRYVSYAMGPCHSRVHAADTSPG